MKSNLWLLNTGTFIINKMAIAKSAWRVSLSALVLIALVLMPCGILYAGIGFKTDNTYKEAMELPAVKNNRLYFATEASFYTFVNYVKQQNNPEHLNQQLQDAGFISCYFLQNNANADQAHLLPTKIKGMEHLLHKWALLLLNANMELQVADKILQFQNGWALIYKEEDQSLAAAFLNSKMALESTEFIYKNKLQAVNVAALKKAALLGCPWFCQSKTSWFCSMFNCN